jgi:hypothetical protein
MKMADLTSCPFVHPISYGPRVEHINSHFHVECRDCGGQGPQGKSWGAAEQLWNTRREPKGDGDGSGQQH